MAGMIPALFADPVSGQGIELRDTQLVCKQAQNTLLSDQQILATLHTQVMTGSVSLIVALGGGSDSSQLPTPAQVSQKLTPGRDNNSAVTGGDLRFKKGFHSTCTVGCSGTYDGIPSVVRTTLERLEPLLWPSPADGEC
jgi:hypothetical protein